MDQKLLLDLVDGPHVVFALRFEVVDDHGLLVHYDGVDPGVRSVGEVFAVTEEFVVNIEVEHEVGGLVPEKWCSVWGEREMCTGGFSWFSSDTRCSEWARGSGPAEGLCSSDL